MRHRLTFTLVKLEILVEYNFLASHYWLYTVACKQYPYIPTLSEAQFSTKYAAILPSSTTVEITDLFDTDRLSTVEISRLTKISQRTICYNIAEVREDISVEYCCVYARFRQSEGGVTVSVIVS